MRAKFLRTTAATVFVLFPKEKLARFSAAALALYIGAGVSMSTHWFSDFVAGAMIGKTIGIVTGRSFRERLSTRALESSRRDT
jgi:hypothetical protein